jgi:LPXTG-site transpeptidase (sortase) family protein
MKTLLSKKWLLIFIVIVFCFAFSIYYNVAFSRKLDTSFLVPATNTSITLKAAANQKQVNLPVRLKIPGIGVDALVESVGITSNGSMGVPKDPKNVAWFNLGVMPGEIGSAVIAGHLDDEKGKAAIFYNLNKLKEGDKLIIKNSQGKNITFVVKKKHIYNTNDYVPEVFSSSAGAHLNLITCSGSWIKSKSSYNKRLVIFADLE